MDAKAQADWERAVEYIRAQGEDPEALVAQAAENLRVWFAKTPEERQAAWDEFLASDEGLDLGPMDNVTVIYL